MLEGTCSGAWTASLETRGLHSACLLLSELPKKAPPSSTNTSLFYVSHLITRMWPKVTSRFGLRPQIPSYTQSSFNYQLDPTWSTWEENSMKYCLCWFGLWASPWGIVLIKLIDIMGRPSPLWVALFPSQ